MKLWTQVVELYYVNDCDDNDNVIFLLLLFIDIIM